MLIYRPNVRQVASRAHVSSLVDAVRHAATTGVHDDIRNVLIELGRFESGLADALAPAADATSPIERLARSATIAAGHWTGASWQHTVATPPQLQELYQHLARLGTAELPAHVALTVPEGYAYYALYPEAYFEAARSTEVGHPGDRASVVGLRSIGTSLSAMVEAGLCHRGLATMSWTVRPRGHPFRRQIEISDTLRGEWAQRRDSWWFVVDEGPGQSGSSLAAAAASLEHLGIPPDRITIVAHWSPRADQLAPWAAPFWDRRRVMTATVDRLGDIDERVAGRLQADRVDDWSGGRWRATVYDQPQQYPAINPTHERVKWRIETSVGPRLVKFAGLGRFGRAVAARYDAAASAGFGPEQDRVEDGLLTLRFIAGVPMPPAACTPTIVDRIGDYLAWSAEAGLLTDPIDLTAVTEMVSTNVREALGDTMAAPVLAGLDADRIHLQDRPTQVLDGRLLPHEWIAGDAGLLMKTDAGEHGDDHFFPGPLDIAWDIASVLVEFDWPPAARRRVIDRYTALSGDTTIDRRLPFYRLAYLAFRTGYVASAAATLAGTDDGTRLMRSAERYVHDLLIAARQYSARRLRRA